MVVILSAPPAAVTAAARRFGLTSQWIGWDGSVWNLGTGSDGVVLDDRGVEGMHFPQVTRYTSQTRAVPGVRRRGWRVQEREVFWPLFIHSEGTSDDYLALQEAFFRTIHPELPGTWRVGRAGQFRELQLTGKFDDSATYGVDPVSKGWAQFGVTMTAAQPYWTGAAVPRGPWSAATSVDFFDAGGSPLFHISEGSTIGSATMSNPGDVPAYPVWKVTGAMSSIELGVGDVVIDVPFNVADGEVLIIDTDPRNLTATLDGVDVTADLGFQRFAPIPAGGTVPIHVEGTGVGNIRAALTPLHFRAF